MIIPPKLQFEDEIRIIAPSRSFSILDEKLIEIALQRLSDLGFHTTLASHIREKDGFSSSSVVSSLISSCLIVATAKRAVGLSLQPNEPGFGKIRLSLRKK